MAEGPAVPRGARALLRAIARQLLPRLLVGDPAARASRVFRRRRPEGLDRATDLRRGPPGLPASLAGAGGARRARTSRRSPSSSKPNDYPAGIRGTLRDAVTYLLAAHLADTSGWSAAQSNEVFRLDLPGSCARRGGDARSVELDDETVHPLVRLVGRARGPGGLACGPRASARALSRRGSSGCAASSLRLRRTRTAARSRRISRSGCRRVADVPWFAMGKAQLAEFVERPDLSGDLVRARAIAREGTARLPGVDRRAALPRDRQAHRGAGLPAPTMQSDGTEPPFDPRPPQERRSMLRFRAFALDLVAARRSRAQPVRDPSQRRRSFESSSTPRRPAAEWTRRPARDARLPLARDLRDSADQGAGSLRGGGLRRGDVRGPRVSSRGRELHPARPRARDAADQRRERERARRHRGPDPVGRDRQADRRRRSVRLPDSLESRSGSSGSRRRPTDAKGIALLRVSRNRVPRAACFVFARRGADLRLDIGTYLSVRRRPPPRTRRRRRFSSPIEASTGRCRRSCGRCSPTGATPARDASRCLPASPVTVTLYDQNNQKVDSRIGRRPTTSARRRASSRFRPAARSAPGGSQSSLGGGAGERPRRGVQAADLRGDRGRTRPSRFA